MEPSRRVLIVEDDAHIAELLRMHLRDEGYAVEHAADGHEGMRRLEEGGWDALVLDLMLPGVDGLEICKRARGMARYTPIIITSARSSEVHRILGLELGADDYLAKPFSMLELVARVRALLRRSDALARNARMDAGTLELHGLAIDPVARTALLDGRALDLTPREFDLLHFFARHPDKVYSRLDLLNQVWGYQHEGYEHTVNTHINRLRTKIEDDPSEPRRILTVWGRGYKFAATQETRHDQAPEPDPAPVRRVRAAVVGLLRRIGLAADGGQRPLRAGSGAAPVGRVGRTYRRRQRTDGRPGLEARGGARAVRQADGRESGGRGLPAGPGRPRCRRCRAAGPACWTVSTWRRCGARWPAACCPSWATIRATPARARFSVAPARAGGKDIGYVYVVLQGQAHDELAMAVSRSTVLRTTLWSIALVALLGLVAGLAAFALITRPLRGLTRAVRAFDGGDSGALAALEDGGRDSDKDGGKDGAPDAARGGDEIVALRRSFAQMGRRISEQWRELTRQDQQRRDMVANISHDLRTPLTSLHGYLETLRLKDATLEADERRRYLDIALAQSRKVGRLAQELFELARLESGLVRLEPEVFSLPELMHDVAQKFELAAEARRQRLHMEIPPDLPAVRADLGLIERVLTNLLDNAIRHTPPGGDIALRLARLPQGLRVQVADTGEGIPASLRAGLFTRASALSHGARDGGGLGLVIVQRILQLHQSEIRLVDREAPGALFQFDLPAAR